MRRRDAAVAFGGDVDSGASRSTSGGREDASFYSVTADMLVVTDVRANDEAFWTEEARALLSGAIQRVAAG
jgi:hypothetical protein